MTTTHATQRRRNWPRRALAALLPVATAIFAHCAPEPRPDGPVRERSAAAAIPAGHDRVRLLLTGAMLGRLEPCGCASGQIGGLARRMHHIGLRDDAYDLLIEGGNLVAGGSELDLHKMYAAVEVLFGMRRRYDALGVGPNDLLLPLAEWADFLSAWQAPVVATDLECERADWPGRPFVEREVRGQKVRILSFAMQLGERAMGAADRDVRLLSAADAWRRGLAGCAEATLRVLLVHADPDTVRALAGSLQPAPDLVAGIDDSIAEPPGGPEFVHGVPVVFTGIRGRILCEVALARLPDGPRIGYSTFPLAGSATKATAGQDLNVRTVLQRHREQVQQERVLQQMAERLPAPGGHRYVGTQRCGECHPSALAAWRDSKHGHAWQTLVLAERDDKRYGWPVTAYPDCVACHSTGYGEQSGFRDADTTSHLAAVGCESCHGPGSAHADSAAGAVKMGRVGNGLAPLVCIRCHDFEQSPGFDYGTRWAQILHGREAR